MTGLVKLDQFSYQRWGVASCVVELLAHDCRMLTVDHDQWRRATLTDFQDRVSEAQCQVPAHPRTGSAVTTVG